MLSTDLRQSASALRLMEDAPACEMREAVLRAADLLDATAMHVAEVEKGVPAAIEVEDHSNLTLAFGLQAGALGVP